MRGRDQIVYCTGMCLPLHAANGSLSLPLEKRSCGERLNKNPQHVEVEIVTNMNDAARVLVEL